LISDNESALPFTGDFRSKFFFRVPPCSVRAAIQSVGGLGGFQYRDMRYLWVTSGLEIALQSWLAHLEHGDTWRLRQQILRNVPFSLDTD
jgi:hypothetical protein